MTLAWRKLQVDPLVAAEAAAVVAVVVRKGVAPPRRDNLQQYVLVAAFTLGISLGRRHGRCFLLRVSQTRDVNFDAGEESGVMLRVCKRAATFFAMSCGFIGYKTMVRKFSFHLILSFGISMYKMAFHTISANANKVRSPDTVGTRLFVCILRCKSGEEVVRKNIVYDLIESMNYCCVFIFARFRRTWRDVLSG